jgi:hypothetical protein
MLCEIYCAYKTVSWLYILACRRGGTVRIRCLDRDDSFDIGTVDGPTRLDRSHGEANVNSKARGHWAGSITLF